MAIDLGGERILRRARFVGSPQARYECIDAPAPVVRRRCRREVPLASQLQPAEVREETPLVRVGGYDQRG